MIELSPSVEEEFREELLSALHDYLSDLVEEVTDLGKLQPSPDRHTAELLAFVEMTRTWGLIAELDMSSAVRSQRNYCELCLVRSAIGEA